MTDEDKAWIDNASYETLLRRWRFSPPGDWMLQVDTLDYYAKILAAKRSENPGDAVRASKTIGWDS